MIRSRPVMLDATEWDAIEPVLQELQSRPVDSSDALVRWLEDRSTFESAASEAQARLPKPRKAGSPARRCAIT